MTVGIDLINPYLCSAYIDVKKLAIAKNIYNERFDKLLMNKKSVHMPFEDAVSCAVNAAKPIIDQLSVEEQKTISTIITASESGVDLGKSMTTYIHKYLGLPHHCRLFEIKQACYSGTAALQMAVSSVIANPGTRVLAICSDSTAWT